MDKFCSYCDTQLYSRIYGCQCTPGLFVCLTCSRIECPGCKQKMKSLDFQRCADCWKQFLPNELLDKYIDRYCYNCCLAALKKSSPKSNVIEFGFIKKIDRSKVEMFLKTFCSKCQKKLAPKQLIQQSNQKSKAQEHLCVECLEKQKKVKTPEKKVKQQSKENQHSEASQKMDMKEKSMSKQQLFEMWRKKQNSRSSYIECVSCNLLIYRHQQNSIITQQMAICGLCARGSKLHESQIEKEKKFKQVKEDDKVMKKLLKSDRQNRPEIQYMMTDRKIKESREEKQFLQSRGAKTEKKGIKNSIAQSRMNKIKTEEKKKEGSFEEKIQEKKEEKPEIKMQGKESKMKKNEEQNQQQQLVVIQEENSEIKKPNKRTQSPRLKKSDSESRLENIQLSIKWTPDSEIIGCSQCGMQIEAINSIWEEEANAPFCKCCFADFLHKLQQQMEKREFQKRMRYRPKDIEDEASKKSNDYMIGHEIKKRTQEKMRSKPKLMQIDEDLESMKQKQKYERTTISKTNPSHEKSNIPPKLRQNSNPKNSPLRDNSSARKSNQSSNNNKITNLSSLRTEHIVAEGMPNTKKFEIFNRGSGGNSRFPSTLDQSPNSNNKDHYQITEKQIGVCQICQKKVYLSKKYLIRDKPVCVECYGKVSLFHKGYRT